MAVFVDRWISYKDFRSADPIDVIVWSHSLPDTSGSERRPQHEGHVLHRVNEQQNTKTTCTPYEIRFEGSNCGGGHSLYALLSGHDPNPIRSARIEDALTKSSQWACRLRCAVHGVSRRANERRAYGFSVMQGSIQSCLQKVGWVAPSCAT